MYFITYSAYDFYDLIPQLIAFGMMVLFPAFNVFAALQYDRQVIAHIGLIGAYAVPFLLGDESGDSNVLFSYMTILNIGILVIAFKRNWKILYYAAFGLTWFIFYAWLVTGYQMSEDYYTAIVFATVFFISFYFTFLAYKLVQKEQLDIDDIIMLLINSFIYFWIGYQILSRHESGKDFLGLFTLANAAIHFIVSIIIYRQKLSDKNLFYLIACLVLVFITIAIPIQLDGNGVTLLWALEAALLFWIGRTKGNPIFEKISYPLMLLSFVSIIQDWSFLYPSRYSEIKLKPILNVNFLSSLIFVGAFGFINWLNQNKKYKSPIATQTRTDQGLNLLFPIILVVAIYFAFRMEISNYWHQLYTDSIIKINEEGNNYSSTKRNYDLLNFKSIWIINYSLLFVSILAVISHFKLKNKQAAWTIFRIIIITILVFLVQGLYNLSDLRESYIDGSLSEYYNQGPFYIWIRYVSYLFVAVPIIVCHKYLKDSIEDRDLTLILDVVIHVSILWITSSELINIMDLSNSSQSYKLGLSILWGVYALILIAIGIWKKKKHLRIGAIILFSITLLKLFFYDITHLDTISKTIVFIALGVLLLIVSFLYNKYKGAIADE